jgi:hypothetical protein
MALPQAGITWGLFQFGVAGAAFPPHNSARRCLLCWRLFSGVGLLQLWAASSFEILVKVASWLKLSVHWQIWHCIGATKVYCVCPPEGQLPEPQHSWSCWSQIWGGQVEVHQNVGGWVLRGSWAEDTRPLRCLQPLYEVMLFPGSSYDLQMPSGTFLHCLDE